jgi:hypothetical protein
MLSRLDVDLGSNEALARLVGEAQAELSADLGLVGGAGSRDDGDHGGERPDD